MKKLLSLVMALVMVLCYVPLSVLATDLEGLMPEIVYRDYDDYLFVDGKRTEFDGKIFDYRHPEKNYVNTYVPVKYFIEIAGGKLTSWEHLTKVAKFKIGDNTLEIDYRNSTYSINGVKNSLRFEPIIEDNILYLSQTDLFVNMFDTTWGNSWYNNNGYMHIGGIDYWWVYGTDDLEYELFDSLYSSNSQNEYTDEIKAGTLYVSDGSHLYNRIYSETSVLGYTDNYVYTLATSYDNLDIPNEKLLISKGNYLYDTTGNKAYAKVSILKSCDSRINELKNCVESSINKAYNNYEITEVHRDKLLADVKATVNEYIAVKRAKKEFAAVNEQKNTYVLKTGSKGDKVTEIQQQLWSLGFSNQLVTGNYGSITVSNVAYFQVINGLKVTGWVDKETYNKILGTDEVIDEPEDMTPYAYPENLQEGMEVIKGWLDVNMEGNKYCDVIKLSMYSSTLFNDGFSESYTIYGNDGSVKFDCTDVGEYTLMVETKSYTTGEIFQYGIDFSVVDTTTGGDLFSYFMLGVWDGVVEIGKGVWSAVSNPIDSLKSLGSGISFLAKALTPWGGEERQVLFDVWTSSSLEIVNNLADKEAKENARAFGKFTSQVIVAVCAEKGVSKLGDVIKESAKTGKLSSVGKAWIKTKEKADDFVAGLTGKIGLASIFKNGKISIEDIKANPKVFSGKTVNEIAEALEDAGYDVTLRTSKLPKSKAQIIQISNTGSGRNITQVQVSPGGGRHGELPYVKISTSDIGIIKIIDGMESMYKTDGKETATIIFTGGN